jgi:hypothetical protein
MLMRSKGMTDPMACDGDRITGYVDGGEQARACTRDGRYPREFLVVIRIPAELNRLFVAARRQRDTAAAIWVYEVSR